MCLGGHGADCGNELMRSTSVGKCCHTVTKNQSVYSSDIVVSNSTYSVSHCVSHGSWCLDRVSIMSRLHLDCVLITFRWNGRLGSNRGRREEGEA